MLAEIYTTTKKQAIELTNKLNLDLSDSKSIIEVDKFLEANYDGCSIYTNIHFTPNKVQNVYLAIFNKLLSRNVAYLLEAATKVTYDRDFQFGEMSDDEMDSKIRDFFNNSMTENDKSLENRVYMKHFYLMAKYADNVTEEVLDNDLFYCQELQQTTNHLHQFF